MNFRRNTRSHAPAVSMASLMDVIFLLLCFFVTSSVFSQWETEVAIALPTAKSATVPGRMPGEIILNLCGKEDARVQNRKRGKNDDCEDHRRIEEPDGGRAEVSGALPCGGCGR